MKKINKIPGTEKFRPLVLLSLAALFILLLFGFRDEATNPEKLLGVSFSYAKKEITIQVVTTGCTVKADFKFSVSNNTITIIRKRRDACKAMPEGTSFTYTFPEAGLSPDKTYTIKNKFIANPNLANIP